MKTDPADLKNLPASLDGWNPRLLAEITGTIALAEEQAPQCGSHTIPFTNMQAINPRWKNFPGAGLACIEYMNVRAVNMALAYMGACVAVYERLPNGDIVVDDPSAKARVRRAIKAYKAEEELAYSHVPLEE